MSLSFKTKALLFFCPIIIVFSFVYTLAAIKNEQRLLRQEIVKRGEILANVAAKSAELPLLTENEERIKSAAVSLGEIENVPFVTFYGRDFDPIIHEGVTAVTPPPEGISVQNPITVVEYRHYFEFYWPVYSEHQSEGMDFFDDSGQTAPIREHIGWVRVGLSKEVMEATAKNMAWNGALFGAGLVVLAVILVSLLLNVALKPLSNLFNAVKDIRDGEYPQVPNIQSGDEIGQLSQEFNKMTRAIMDREQMLLQSQKRIKELFERVEHAIFRLDHDFKIIESNTKFRELCEEDADFFCMIPEEKRDSFIKKAMDGKLIAVEDIISCTDAKEHTIYLSLYPEIDDEGIISGYDGHFVDVTEKKALEQALLQTQKLESLGLLAGGIAHDFNNILSGIIGYSELALIELPQDSHLRPYLNEIYEAGDRAAGLTRQLLVFSRKQVNEMKVINIGDVITNLSKMLGRLIGETIEMKLLVNDKGDNVHADPGQIEQVVMNLAVNAKDAMPDGGSLIFETGGVYLDENYCKAHGEVSPGNYVTLTVTDNGHGMTQDIRENIFDPFFTTKVAGAGTGLGLSTVYGIVKQHKGHIYVYSEVGFGTTFKIFFPQVEGEAVDVGRGVAGEMPTGTETIMVVDDEKSIRNLICDTLKPLGYTVFEASSGKAAVEMIKQEEKNIDLVLTDVIMPQMGGRELAEEVNVIQPQIKVLFMSGYTDNVIAHQGVLAPGILFISKPIVPTLLCRKIRQILDEHIK